MCHSNSITFLTCVINGWGVSAQYGGSPTCFFQESINKQVFGKVPRRFFHYLSLNCRKLKKNVEKVRYDPPPPPPPPPLMH